MMLSFEFREERAGERERDGRLTINKLGVFLDIAVDLLSRADLLSSFGWIC